MNDEPYADLKHPGNGKRYRTGKLCLMPGCNELAGTAWSRYWCVQHNIERMRRIDAKMAQLRKRLEGDSE